MPTLPLASILACLVGTAAPAAAQSQLEPVVVTGSREPQPLDRVTADVVVIDAQTIRDSTADSIEDLLRREAGVQVSRNGGPGQNASVLIRGANASGTVVLVDGVRVGSATLGQVEFESISLTEIDHIEVLRGPASSLYGADAVGGVIQIFTRRGDGALRFTAHAAGGTYGAYQGSVGVSGSNAGFDYAAGYGREGDRGVSAVGPTEPYGDYNPDADGYKRESAHLKLGYTPAPGHRIGLNFVESRLNSQFDSSDSPPPDYIPNPAPDFRNKLRTDVLALDYRGVVNSLWTTSAQLSTSMDDLRSGADTIDHYRTQRNQFTWQNALAFTPDQQVVLAYEHLDEKADSNDYVADYERINNAFVAGYTGRFGAQVVQADLRHDANSIYGGDTTGRLGWSLEVAKGLRVRALAGTTFRAPSFNELFFPGYGVSTVTPEHGRSVEVGVNWRAGDSDASATLYRNRVRDLIETTDDLSLCPSDPAFAYGCAHNVGRARLQGATLAGGQRWGAWRVAGTVDFLDARDLDTGQRLNLRAAHQESLRAEYQAGAWALGAALLQVGARPNAGTTLGSYATVDLDARWQFAPQWQFNVKLLNAMNKQYEPVRYYLPLGRQAWIGLRYDAKGI